MVLIVGMHHHDDVGAGAQCGVVTGLLIAAVATIRVVPQHAQSQARPELSGVVSAAVIGQDDFVDCVRRDIRQCTLERPTGIVGRHHCDDACATWGCGPRRLWILARHE